MSTPPLTFDERVVVASWSMQQGDPMRDFLEPWEIEQAIHRLADVYTALGTKLPE